MLFAEQDQRIVQTVKVLILRTREQNAGTGIFYHTDLRRDVLIPKNPDQWLDNRVNWAAHAGLSSKIGGTFSEIPDGMKTEHLYAMLGTVVESNPIVIPTVEGETTTEDPNGLTCSFEILRPDMLQIQEQNQMALLVTIRGFIQANTQDYGEGFDEDGRDREILRGSLWAVPQYYSLSISRPELKTAAGSAAEVREILEKAKVKNAQRALSARTESFANRATRDQQRATGKMPQRRGTNTHIQAYGGPMYGPGNSPTAR